MTTARHPGDAPVRMIWLGATERSALRAAIETFSSGITCLPVVADALTGAVTELDVVEARDALWPHTSMVTRRAGGIPADSMPVRLSADELHVLTTLPTLPEHVRVALTARGAR